MAIVKTMEKIYNVAMDICHRPCYFVAKSLDIRKQGGIRQLLIALIEKYHVSETIVVDCNEYYNERDNYKKWIAAYNNKNKAMATLNECSAHDPSIALGIIVPDQDKNALISTISSIEAQSYQGWKILLLVNASNVAYVRNLLEAGGDISRVRMISCQPGRYDNETFRKAVEQAETDYIAFIRSGDRIPSHALSIIAHGITNNRGKKIIYTDNDFITDAGIRHDPQFKPDWDPELFLSTNYISNLCVIKAEFFRSVDRFIIEPENFTLYDFLLKALSHITADDILHIPHILYHALVDDKEPGATAQPSGEQQRELLALQEYFGRTNSRVRVESTEHAGIFRRKYPLPENPPLVSLIVPTRNGYNILSQCIASIIEKTSYRNYEILVVNNRSTDRRTLKYLDRIAARRDVRIIDYDHEFNYSAINNYAVKQAAGSVVGLINNDIEVREPEWLTEMASYAIRDEIGAVGAKLLYPDGRVQHGGVLMGLEGSVRNAHRFFPGDHAGYGKRLSTVQSFAAVTAACLVVRKELYDKVGGLNEQDLPVAFNDVDLCLRLVEAGYVNVWTPYAVLVHHESVSRGHDDTPEERARSERETEYLLRRWGSWFVDDPHYNPNLTLAKTDFSLAWPPRTRQSQGHE